MKMPDDDIVVRVVKAVAAADDTGVDKLEPLGWYVDPGTLEDISEQETGEWRFSFRYVGHRVTITHDEQLLVDGERYPSSEVTDRQERR